MKKKVILLIALMVISIGYISGCTNNHKTEEITLTPSSNLILAGNLSYPGFYAWSNTLQKGDKVEMTVTATSDVNLYVVPDSAHTTWAATYYHTTNPGLYYPTEQAIYTSGQILSTIVIFTVPNDGIYDLVALNTRSNPTTVSISGKIIRNS